MDNNRKHSQQGETKQNKRAKTTTTDTSFDPAAAHPSFFVQSELIPKEYKDKNICSNFLGDLTDQWVVVFSFLDLSYKDRIEMRCYCRLFHKVENILTLNKHGYEMLTPIPKWTEFPHPKYSTLNELMDKLNAMYAALPSDWEECTVPGSLVVETKVRAKYVDEYSDDDDADDTDDEFYNATIQKVNDADETFDIVFDDNDYGTRINVPLNEIQIQTVSVIKVFFFCAHIKAVQTLFIALLTILFYLFYIFSLNLFYLFFFHIRRKASWQKRKRTKKCVFNL